MTLVRTVLVDVTEPGEPVPAPRPRIARRGGAYYSKRYTSYRETLRAAFLASRNRNVPLRYSGRVRVTIDLAVTKAGDVDNYAKTVLDALSDVVLADDRQVDELHVVRQHSAAPGIHVVVESLEVR